MSSRRILMGACLAAPILCAPIAAKTVRLGLVVGHNRGLDGDPRLQFAESDAQKMGDLFQEVGGMDEDRLILLKSPRPEELNRAFQDIRSWSAAVPPEDEVVFLFYFSGHGTDKNLKLGRQTYSMQDLKQNIDGVPAKLRIGILDACQSGAITRLKGARLVQPFVLEQQLRSQGSILITSSAEDENSQESEQLQGSFFTHYLMSALRGAGDVSGDRRVTLLEAYQYAFQKTLVETEQSRGGPQHAKAQMNLDVEGDVVLTDLNTGRGGLVFKPELSGEMLVANARSQVMGEFHKEKGKEAFLALPPGVYKVFLKDGRKTMQYKAKLKDMEIREVGENQLSSGFRFVGMAKGGSAEEEVVLPWNRQDFPAQFPLQVGTGWINNYSQLSLTAMAGYRFWPQLGIYGSYAIHKTWDKRLWSGGNAQALELGLESGKFLSENIEFTGSLFHAARKPMVELSYFTLVPCAEGSSELCDEAVYRPDTPWIWSAATGTTFGARVWIWNHVSLALRYGVEWTWGEGKFNPSFLTIVPALHF